MPPLEPLSMFADFTSNLSSNQSSSLLSLLNLYSFVDNQGRGHLSCNPNFDTLKKVLNQTPQFLQNFSYQLPTLFNAFLYKAAEQDRADICQQALTVQGIAQSVLEQALTIAFFNRSLNAAKIFVEHRVFTQMARLPSLDEKWQNFYITAIALRVFELADQKRLFLDAMQVGCLKLCDFMLKLEDFDPSFDQHTALLKAVNLLNPTHRIEILKLLLAHPKTDPNALDFQIVCQICFWRADEYQMILPLFFSHPNFNLDQFFEHFFLNACRQNHTECVRPFINQPYFNPALRDSLVLQCGFEKKAYDVIKLLALDSRIDFSAVQYDREFYFDYVLEPFRQNHIDVVFALLQAPTFKPNAHENLAIQEACRKGALGVLALLEKDPRVDSACQMDWVIVDPSVNETS